MALGFGAVNEMIEFLFGLNNTNLHAGGLDNAGWDLVFNLAGGVVGVVWLVAHRDQVDDEDERLVRADDAARPLAAVREVRRDR